MGTTTSAEEFSYAVEHWYWQRFRGSAIRAARKLARQKGMTADGDPQVHVVLVWPQEQGAESVA
jgi:hypothetical protein